MLLDLDCTKQSSNKKLMRDFNGNASNNTTVIEQEHLNNNLNDKNGLTTLQKFYSGQTIFVTGGTGFLGKVLLEKLLRCCPDVARIYLLVRSKKEKNADERIKDLLNDVIFDTVRPEMTKLGKKIIGINGDCSLPDLGLNTSDINLLTNDTTVVFHVAATVRFNEKLKQATAINVQGTASILELCKNMKKLKSFIHVSTAYSNCFTSNIEEKFYDYAIKPEELIDLVKNTTDDAIENVTPNLLGSWPNTYTFTKALAEDLIRTKSKSLPIGIFRPGIVISTAREPISGWIDNYYGPTMVIAGGSSGVKHVVHCNPNLITNLIPVDMTINALIASAWDVAMQTQKRDEDTLIYNFTSTEESPITWGTFLNTAEKYQHMYPSNAIFWYSFFLMTKYKFIYSLYFIFFEWMPSILFDSMAIILGKKAKLQKICQMQHKFTTVTRHFTFHEWCFKNDNVKSLWSRLDSEDKKLFRFNMENFDWEEYLSNYVKGIRTYLFKENLGTLEESRTKQNKLYLLHQSLILFLLCLTCWLLRNAYFVIF